MAALPLKISNYTVAGTPAQQSHTFDADCTEAIIQAKDGAFAISPTSGFTPGTNDYTILSTDKLVLQNRNLANRTLYFFGVTAGKILEVIEILGRSD